MALTFRLEEKHVYCMEQSAYVDNFSAITFCHICLFEKTSQSIFNEDDLEKRQEDLLTDLSVTGIKEDS